MRLTARRVVMAAAIIAGSLAPADVWAVYVFTNVADTTTSAPSGTFSSFGSIDSVPAISGGTATFYGAYSGGSGIFTGSGGSLATIAKTGDPAPTGAFTGFGFGPAISGGTVAFRGTYGGGGGVFSSSGGPITTIAKFGDPAPFGTFFEFGAGVGISSDSVVFRGGTGFGVHQGIFTGYGGPLTTIAKDGDPAPSGTFTNSFGALPAISGATAAFRVHYSGGSGIFIGNGGMVTTIVKTGDPAPSGTFGTGFFSNPTISGNEIAFSGQYSGGYGIFRGSGGGPLTTIAKTGDPAPFGTFTSVGGVNDEPAISGGTVAFFGRYNGGTQSGIFTGNGGPLTTVIVSGDPLFGSAVTTLNLGGHALDPGGSGRLAFSYGLADGRTGVAIATPVPEPTTMVLLVLAVLVFCLDRPATGRRRSTYGTMTIS